jgi:hypothetical protein
MPLYVPVLISIATLVVTLIVAAMHRKQMRQIELHRVDPTVPLVPPAHPITQSLKKRVVFIINIGVNLLLLANELRKTGPMTRGDVFSIALLICVLTFVVTMEVAGSLIKAYALGLQGRDVNDRPFQDRDREGRG